MEKPSEKLHPNRQEDEQDMEMEPVVLGPPSFGSPDPMTQSGRLVSVDEHPLELGEDYGKGAVVASEKAEGDENGPPAQSATRAEWDEYAQSQGVDPSEFGSKDELIAHFS